MNLVVNGKTKRKATVEVAGQNKSGFKGSMRKQETEKTANWRSEVAMLDLLSETRGVVSMKIQM